MCLSHFEGKILKRFEYGTKLTGRGDDIVIHFDKLALDRKLVLCDYWLIPFHTKPFLTRFKSWRKPFRHWQSSFINQRLISITQHNNVVYLKFSGDKLLTANANFVTVCSDKNYEH